MHAALERPYMGKGCCKETAVRSSGVRGHEGMQATAEIFQSQSHPVEIGSTSCCSVKPILRLEQDDTRCLENLYFIICDMPESVF